MIHLPAAPTPDVAFVLACCRPPSLARNAIIANLATSVDWPSVLALARRHRVQGLVAGALMDARATPTSHTDDLARDARRIATDALRLAGESVRLVELLRRKTVPVVVLKGTALAMHAHGTLTTKMAWDIDLLVPEAAVIDAAEVLVAAGYHCLVTGNDHERLIGWVRRNKDSAWHDPARDIYVELHTRLFNQPTVLDNLDPFFELENVIVANGLTLPALTDAALFAYLSVHGAVSGWRRAKWLADFAGWLASATTPKSNVSIADRGRTPPGGRRRLRFSWPIIIWERRFPPRYALTSPRIARSRGLPGLRAGS